MKRSFKTLALFAAALGASLSVHAADPMSPVGLWKAQEDGKDRFLIRITENGGKLSGAVEKILSGDQNERCTECPSDDPRKDKPVLGMVILKDLKKDGNEYEGGTLLGITKGRVLKAEAKVDDGGKTMSVKAKFGFLGKTFTWTRVE